MKVLIKISILFFLLFFSEQINAKSWCKAIYNQNILPGELQKQINKCKNSDNFFLAIHSSYKNAGHLLNSFVAEFIGETNTFSGEVIDISGGKCKVKLATGAEIISNRLAAFRASGVATNVAIAATPPTMK